MLFISRCSHVLKTKILNCMVDLAMFTIVNKPLLPNEFRNIYQ